MKVKLMGFCACAYVHIFVNTYSTCRNVITVKEKLIFVLLSEEVFLNCVQLYVKFIIYKYDGYADNV